MKYNKQNCYNCKNYDNNRGCSYKCKRYDYVTGNYYQKIHFNCYTNVGKIFNCNWESI